MATCTGPRFRGMACCKKHNLLSFHSIQAEWATEGKKGLNMRGFVSPESPHSPCKSHHGRKQFGLFASLSEKNGNMDLLVSLSSTGNF